MDKAAKQQACQLLIEQEIEAGLAEGKSKYAIGKEISEWIAKLFDAHIEPHVIEVQAHRSEKRLLTNVSSPVPTSKDKFIEKIIEETKEDGPKEEPEWQDPPIQPQIKPAKKEVKKKEPEIISAEFKTAWEGLMAEIKNAKALKWKTTSREAAFRHIEILKDVISI